MKDHMMQEDPDVTSIDALATMNFAELRAYAARSGIKGAHKIAGGRDALVDAILSSRRGTDMTVQGGTIHTTETLRAMAVAIGIKGAHKIPGGKQVLIDQINTHLAKMDASDPRLTPFAHILGNRVAKVTYDLTSNDRNLDKILSGVRCLPESVLEAEYEYARTWGPPPQGWSDMDQLRYNLRFYPFHRAQLAKRIDLPDEMRALLRKDQDPMVRKAAWRVHPEV